MFIDNTEFKTSLLSYIDTVVQKEQEHAKTYGKLSEELMMYFRKLSLNGGKMIRGYLVYIGSTLRTEGDPVLLEKVLPLAAAIEIFHTSVLIHDDVIDHGTSRRSMETFHEHFDKVYSPHGEALAINTGDVGYFLSMQCLLQGNGYSVRMQADLIAAYTKQLITVLYGQSYDVVGLHNRTLEDVINMYNLKTALYTIQLPLSLGLIVDKKKRYMHAYDRFSYHAGIVFQLEDDMLDIFANPEDTGKTACSDIREGKMNAVNLIALGQTSKTDREYLDRLMHKEDVVDIEKVRSIMKESGSYNKVLELQNQHKEKAHQALDKAGGSKDALETLHLLIEKMAKPV